MIGLEVVGLRETVARYTRLIQGLDADVEKAMRQASLELRAALGRQMNARAGTDPFLGRLGAQPPYLGRRTGHLARSLTPGGVVYKVGDELRTSVGTAVPYSKLLEDGGVITGRPYLRIPLANAQKASGEDRYAGTSVRGLKEFFAIRTLGGRLFLARNAGGSRSQRVDFWYLLVRSVRIRPHKVFETVTAAIRSRVEALIGGSVRLAVQRANNG